MRVVVSGASGLIGTALTASLEADGHDVVALVRREARGPRESAWDPTTGTIDASLIAGADAVVNLAGASIGGKRLTPAYKREVLASRVNATRTIAEAIAASATPPALLQGSSMGFYGDAADAVVDEASPRGEGFLADVCVAWEEAASPAVEAGARVVFLRTGLVLASHGGFAQRLLPLVRRGLFGGFGAGRAFQSWITLEDHVRALRALLEAPVAGPVNVISPEPVTDATLVAELSRAFGKRPGLKVPGWALRIAIGEAIEDLLASQRGEPGVLARLGFVWNQPTMASAAAWVAAAARAGR